MMRGNRRGNVRSCRTIGNLLHSPGGLMDPSMSKTYSQIQKQIETLSRDAEKLKQKEVESAVSRIREAIETYGLSAADLGLGTQREPRGKAAAKKGTKAGPKSASQAKYRDESGNVWGGRGPRPQWLRDALGAGRELKDFAV
jgi:DNA-binding protein H-NS